MSILLKFLPQISSKSVILKYSKILRHKGSYKPLTGVLYPYSFKKYGYVLMIIGTGGVATARNRVYFISLR